MNDVIPMSIDWSNKEVEKPIFSIGAAPESTISFHNGNSEILKITEDGFYVRGIKVPADEKEAESVYRAFKQFLIYHGISRP